MVKKSEAEKLADMVAMVRRDSLLKEEDVADIIAEAEATGDYAALYRAYIRRRRRKAEVTDYYPGMTEAKRAAEAETLRREMLEKARRRRAQGKLEIARRLEAAAGILDFDPKQRGPYYTRLFYHEGLDLDDESPLGPMRFTDKVYQDEGDDIKPKLCEALNIFFVKVASSDVGYPIHVYGTIIARDKIDLKCLYLFRRVKDCSQLIRSKDESLILTGPKRGLVLRGNAYVEIDLKTKDRQGQERELGKGILNIRDIAGQSLEECKVESKSLATRLSTVDVMYAFVRRAVEATIAVEVVQGDFCGKITAYSTSIINRFVLHDSNLAGVMSGDDKGVIQLMRPVVCVPLLDFLYIVVKTGDGESVRVIEFTPRVNGGDEAEITVGAIQMRVKVTWSTLDF